ncbi:MAG: hypothetical protein LUO89_11110 [Methanothrix sp.]|nr:hypothetical protein [Methanothrix sp.]
MMVRQVELAAFIEVTLEAGLGTLPWINNGFGASPYFDMDAARAMTGLTPGRNSVSPGGHQPRVSRCFEITRDFLVTLGAFIRADILGPRHLWRDHHGGIHRATGNHDHRESQAAKRHGRNPVAFELVTNSPNGGWGISFRVHNGIYERCDLLSVVSSINGIT